MTKTRKQEWLLIFYSVPSHPVSNRMKIWRKLAKAGAVQLKGAVYIIPATEEHEEFFQWLIGEVKSMGGDGAFVKSAEIKTIDETDIRKLFVNQIEKELRGFEKTLDVQERRVESIRKGTLSNDSQTLLENIVKLDKEFQEIRKRDFFLSSAGHALSKRIQAIQLLLKGFNKRGTKASTTVTAKRKTDYHGRTWITRKNPFIDRMASAWLIKRFIDKDAHFRFIDEQELSKISPNGPIFDMRGGEFTHVGDLCTFEVLIRSFNIKDKAVRKMGEIVHDLDVKDEKYRNPEAAGIEDILSGIRKTAKNDIDALERGMAVFEMVYQSRL